MSDQRFIVSVEERGRTVAAIYVDAASKEDAVEQARAYFAVCPLVARLHDPGPLAVGVSS